MDQELKTDELCGKLSKPSIRNVKESALEAQKEEIPYSRKFSKDFNFENFENLKLF